MPINSIKPGVKLDKLSPQMALAWSIACSVYNARGHECILTSGSDGKHKTGSKHYSGHGIDLRTKHLGYREPSYGTIQGRWVSAGVQEVSDSLKRALGDNYDVVLESDHIHVEYDPK